MTLPVIYFDECADHRALPYLISRGIIVETAPDQQTLSYADDPQLMYASERACVLLTTNWRHFHTLHRLWQDMGRSHGGIILVPQDDISPQRFAIRCAMRITWAGTDTNGTINRLYRWADLQVLLQQGYMPVGFTEHDVRVVLGAG